MTQRRIVGYLEGLAGPVAALACPARLGVNLQSETAAASLTPCSPPSSTKPLKENYEVRPRIALRPFLWQSVQRC